MPSSLLLLIPNQSPLLLDRLRPHRRQALHLARPQQLRHARPSLGRAESDRRTARHDAERVVKVLNGSSFEGRDLLVQVVRSPGNRTEEDIRRSIPGASRQDHSGRLGRRQLGPEGAGQNTRGRAQEARWRHSRSDSVSPPPKRRRMEDSGDRRGEEPSRSRAASTGEEVMEGDQDLTRSAGGAEGKWIKKEEDFSWQQPRDFVSSSPISSESPSHPATHSFHDLDHQPLDHARLHSLSLSSSDLSSITRLSQPLFNPPTSFSRTVNTHTPLGYLSLADARRALLQPSPFADDERIQALYEAFLEAQIGEGREGYDVVAGQVVEFGRNSERFMREVVGGGGKEGGQDARDQDLKHLCS